MSEKSKFAARGQEMSSIMASLTDDILSWRNVYWDRAYNAGGADAIVDGDVASLGVTAADVTGLITFADALETFLVANRAYLSQMRSDM